MPTIEESTGTPGVYTVRVAADELAVASGKRLPYAAWIGTIDPERGKVTVWTPAASVPRGYRAAAEAVLRGELAKLRRAFPVTASPLSRLRTAITEHHFRTWADARAEVDGAHSRGELTGDQAIKLYELVDRRYEASSRPSGYRAVALAKRGGRGVSESAGLRARIDGQEFRTWGDARAEIDKAHSRGELTGAQSLELYELVDRKYIAGGPAR